LSCAVSLYPSCLLLWCLLHVVKGCLGLVACRGGRACWPAIRCPWFGHALTGLLRRDIRGDIPRLSSQSLHPHSPVIPPNCRMCRFWSLPVVTILVSWRFPRCETLGFTPFCGVQGSGMGAALPRTMRTTEDRLTALLAAALMLSGCSVGCVVARLLGVL
jgi:hypothetical protein